MGSWTSMLCLQFPGKLNPAEALGALEQLGMMPDKTSFLTRPGTSGETEIKDNHSREPLSKQLRSGAQLQVILRNEDTFISFERAIDKTFDSFLFSWQNSVFARAQERFDYLSKLRNAAVAANAALSLTVRDPPDDWLGILTLRANECEIESRTPSGRLIPAFTTEIIKTGTMTTHRPPHPIRYCISIPTGDSRRS